MPKKKGELSIEERLEQSIVAKEEEPYKLPSNWVWTRLGDISLKLTDGSHNPPKNQDSNYRMLSAKNIFNRKINFFEDDRRISKEDFEKENNRTKLENNDIVLTIVGTIGRTALVKLNDTNLTFQRSVAVIKTFILQEYLELFMNSKFFNQELYKNAKGTAQLGIYLNKLKDLKIAIPPLEEQKRIVEKLDSLFEKIQKIKEIIEEVKEKSTSRREAILSKAFSGELTEKWRGENHSENARELLVKINDEKLKLWEDECKKAEDEGRKKPAKPKLKTIDEMLVGAEEMPYKLPNNWVWTRLGDITDINPKKKILDFNDDEEISFVPMKAVSDETGKIEEMEYEKYSKLKKGYTQFIEEDVLFAKITPCMENGKCAIAKNLKNDIGYGTTEFHVLRCYQGIINKLLHIFLRQESFRKEAKYNMTGSVGFQRVPVDFLKTALFPLPPLEEQKEIVRVLDKVFEEENRISELISLENKIEILEKTILDRAFRGELGTGNNDDEPAIELLKKCLEER